MHLNNYGMLIPCGIDVFSGVEFVCCHVGDATAKPVAEATPSKKPASLWDQLKQKVSKVTNLVSSELAGKYAWSAGLPGCVTVIVYSTCKVELTQLA